jgi:hypothetical protein
MAIPSHRPNNKYQEIIKPRADEPINDNEIRVTVQGRLKNYISYAMNLFAEKKQEVVLKAMGGAINKTGMSFVLLW